LHQNSFLLVVLNQKQENVSTNLHNTNHSFLQEPSQGHQIKSINLIWFHLFNGRYNQAGDMAKVLMVTHAFPRRWTQAGSKAQTLIVLAQDTDIRFSNWKYSINPHPLALSHNRLNDQTARKITHWCHCRRVKGHRKSLSIDRSS
jgi:hypothetical protein